MFNGLALCTVSKATVRAIIGTIFSPIIGSIIGYYFGESAASRRGAVIVEEDALGVDPSAEGRMQTPQTSGDSGDGTVAETPGIRPVGIPPSLKAKMEREDETPPPTETES